MIAATENVHMQMGTRQRNIWWRDINYLHFYKTQWFEKKNLKQML